MADSYEYYSKKKPDKLYVSSRFNAGQPARPMRIANRVFDNDESHEFVTEGREIVIHVSSGGRNEIKVTFYEDDRQVERLVIQKYVRSTGLPVRQSFSFDSSQLKTLVQFISDLQILELSDPNKVNVTDPSLRRVVLTEEQWKTLAHQNQKELARLARFEITEQDVVALGYRKKQLLRFEELLASEATSEKAWQEFFEDNKWVFGYGLTYIWNSPVDDGKLERSVAGSTFWQSGKRADSVMKSAGVISALCFVEIKKHSTELLQPAPYRGASWAPTVELSGGVIQSQITVQAAVDQIRGRLPMTNDAGDPSGLEVFAILPRSYLIIGNLDQFLTEHGVNEEKFRSFELYRRNIANPEIITYDELFSRARAIVECDTLSDSE